MVKKNDGLLYQQSNIIKSTMASVDAATAIAATTAAATVAATATAQQQYHIQKHYEKCGIKFTEHSVTSWCGGGGGGGGGNGSSHDVDYWRCDECGLLIPNSSV
jgi:hypothetical protein